MLGALRVASEGDGVQLIDIVADDDLLACVADAAGAGSIGQLSCCSQAFQQHCTADVLWTRLLRGRWGEKMLSPQRLPGAAHRAYASQHVRVRWSAPVLATPKTTGVASRRRQPSAVRPSPTACRTLRTPLGVGKENITPSSVNRASWRTPTGTPAARLGRGSRTRLGTRTARPSPSSDRLGPG